MKIKIVVIYIDMPRPNATGLRKKPTFEQIINLLRGRSRKDQIPQQVLEPTKEQPLVDTNGWRGPERHRGTTIETDTDNTT